MDNPSQTRKAHRRYSALAAVAMAGPVLVGALAGVAVPGHAQAQESSSGRSARTPVPVAQAMSAVTPAQKAAALAGAHGLVNKMAHIESIKSGGELANLFSNRSAGSVGIIMSVAAKLAIAMSGAMSEKEGGKAPKGMSPKQADAVYTAFEKRWGISGPMPKSPLEHLPPIVAKNGRGFLLDEIALMSKISGSDKNSFSKGVKESASSFSESDITYTVLSPTRVRLMRKPKAGKKPGAPLYAVLEDNAWRLDIGDILTSSNKSASQKPG